MRKCFAVSLVVTIMMFVSAGVGSAQDFGVKGGLVFADFNSDVLRFDNALGWQAGVFFGTRGPVGVLGEVNVVQHRTRVIGPPDFDVSVTYLQIPVMLRVSGGSNAARIYGVVGPSFDFKIGDSAEGIHLNTDVFNGYNVGIAGGVGVELAHILIEGRYTHGFRQVNKFDFNNAAEINTHSFAVLVGVGF